MAVDTSPAWAIMSKVEDPLLAAHLCKETSLRFLMAALEYRGAEPMSLEERAALTARSPFEAERLAFDVAFDHRNRSAIVEGLEGLPSGQLAVRRLTEGFRGSKASALVAAAVSDLDQ